MLRIKFTLVLTAMSLITITNGWGSADTTLVDCATLAPDSIRIECLLDQGQYWWNKSDGERAMPLGREAYRKSLDAENIRQQGRALRVIAYSFYIEGRYDSAAVYAEQAVNTFLSKDYFERS